MSPPLFDRIAVVDWSANAAPKTGPDSIWIAIADNGKCVLSNPSTRRSAIREIEALAEPGRRTLVGVDFSLGFPSGTAELLGLAGLPWSEIWAHLGAAIVDNDNNGNNRFDVATHLNALMGSRQQELEVTAGPFWGCPQSKAGKSLTATKPTRAAWWPSEWRAVERRLRTDGLSPFSSWQLLGAGAVGSQSLVGIAALERLRRKLGSRLIIWPFETGLDIPQPTQLVVAEVWPSLWDVPVPVGVVKDAAQVEATARRLAQLDSDGLLGAMFSPGVAAADQSAVIDEEGWVLGVASGGS